MSLKIELSSTNTNDFKSMSFRSPKGLLSPLSMPMSNQKKTKKYIVKYKNT